MYLIIQKLFIDYLKKNYIHIISFIIIISLINPLQSVILSRLYGYLFSMIKNSNKLPSFFDLKNILKQNAAGIIMLICLVYIILFFLYMSKNYLETLIVPNYFKFLRTLFFNNFIKKYSNDYKDVKIGEVLSKLFELNMSVIYLFQYVCNYFLSTFIGLFVIGIYYLYLDWKIGIIFILSIGIILTNYYINSKYQLINSVKKFDILYDNNEKLTDRLSNLLNIYINNEQDNEINKFIKSEFTFRRQYIYNYWIEKKMVSSTDCIIVITAIIILILSYYLYKNKKINTVGFISIIVTLGTALEYLFALNSEISNCFYQLGIIKSNQKLLNEIIYLKKRKIIDIKLENGNIEFRNVTFSYDNNKNILHKFNYKIKNGEKVAIIGQSGSGKTTIMKLLIHLHDLKNGKILIDNFDISNINTEYLRSKIIYINQKTVLFNRSILDNMIYGTQKNKHDVIDLLNKYDLMILFNKLPNSIYSQAGVNGNNLSLGMQKIAMIIRGVLKDGLIYAFDEPLTSLDGKTRKKVIKMLMEELKNKTLIIITHDKEIIPYMNKTLKMHELKNE